MIAGAGLGVAMGHAPVAVRAAADHVTSDHHGDGVGGLFTKFCSRLELSERLPR